MAHLQKIQFSLAFIMLLKECVKNRKSMGEIRLQKDIDELTLYRYSAGLANISVSLFYKEKDWVNLPVSFEVKPELFHLYSGAWFHCTIKIPFDYPFGYPKVFVKNRVLHPNVDVESGEFLLDESIDWRATMTINALIVAIEKAVCMPNPELIPNTELNREMGESLRCDPNGFFKEISQVIKGGHFFGYFFEPHFGKSYCMKRKRNSNDFDEYFKRKCNLR